MKGKEVGCDHVRKGIHQKQGILFVKRERENQRSQRVIKRV